MLGVAVWLAGWASWLTAVPSSLLSLALFLCLSLSFGPCGLPAYSSSLFWLSRCHWRCSTWTAHECAAPACSAPSLLNSPKPSFHWAQAFSLSLPPNLLSSQLNTLILFPRLCPSAPLPFSPLSPLQSTVAATIILLPRARSCDLVTIYLCVICTNLYFPYDLSPQPPARELEESKPTRRTPSRFQPT